ncbi:MAG: competence/damage-inducible protein A [Christensenellaceae bacterium]|nr:competence/damage-inducible protein A [Christensenellaceae bacterium]
MKAEILCVGTEILLGDIVNTNAAYIARELARIGIDLYHQSVVGDNPDRLKESIDLAFSRADLVIMTGGLGPTYDDLTKETVANYFGLKMVMDEKSLERLEMFFTQRKKAMTENNKKQAMMPEGATVFLNDNGTAPGLAVNKNGKTAVLMPGPPREMCPMLDEKVIPYLMQFSTKIIKSHEMHMIGIGESAMEQQLRSYIESLEDVTVAPYAKDGECMVRVTAAARTEAEAEQLMQPVMDEIQKRMDKYIYGIDVPNLETELIIKLKEAKKTIATAESCTGGTLSKRITDVAGASEVFGYGLCTYANEAKVKLLGVKQETLDAYGAVSEQTALEMARGIKAISGADIGLSTTGIAGPGGGTDEKPVGLVYVGIACDKFEKVIKLNLGYGVHVDRDRIRLVAASNALSLALTYFQ